jgi:electron transfer flavoprotein alpha subunit
MKRDLEIWVFGDHRRHPKDRLTLQVLGHARALSGNGGRVTAVILGHQLEEIAREYIACGAQRILLVDHPQLALYRTDLFTTMISDLIREHKPDIFLTGASEFGKELAAGIAKRIGVGLGADCVSLDWDEEKESLIGFSPAFGGNFLARIVWGASKPCMATLNPGTFPERPYDKAAHGEIVKVEKDLDHISSRIKMISSVREPHHADRLEDARTVVVGGRGVKNSQGFNNIRELALLLGGEVGATRPAVDAHWTSHGQLIGQTGKSIKPALLITCGTSGAIQYTAALGGPGTFVAVNRDPFFLPLLGR